MAFRYELRYADGEDAGSIETSETRWQSGDTLIGHGNRHYRVAAVIPIGRVEEFVEKPLAGVLEVEPLPRPRTV
jgi:hypothetical protein